MENDPMYNGREESIFRTIKKIIMKMKIEGN